MTIFVKYNKASFFVNMPTMKYNNAHRQMENKKYTFVSLKRIAVIIHNIKATVSLIKSLKPENFGIILLPVINIEINKKTYDTKKAIAAPLYEYNGIRRILNKTFIPIPITCEIRTHFALS